MSEQLDILWIVLCSALVFLMQAGFLCLETGLTRQKNNINVAIKNLADFCLTAIVFWVFGFALMFGDSVLGWFGNSHYILDFSTQTGFLTVFFIFQVMFCGTAVTIISGAVAERLHFGTYMIIAFVISGLVYPVAGHWAWGGFEGGVGNGWLADMGFVDFAGSSVVHSIGGWASLALLIIIGPRIGRFGDKKETQEIIASNVPLATLGVVFLFVGWLGFNGGSTLAMNDQVPLILANTLIAGSAGALAAGGLGVAVQQKLNVTQFMNGALGGLVSITAGCFAVTTPIALLIGIVGGMVVVFVEELLVYVRLDDAVGAIPVHLGAGIWGTIATGLYGNIELLGTGLTRGEQIWVQFLGVFSYAAWGFCVPFVIFTAINRFKKFRVSREDELLGLNISEHGLRSEADSNNSTIHQRAEVEP